MCAINSQDEHSKPKSGEKASEKYTRPLLVKVIARMESTESFLLYETLGDRTFIAVWRNLLF